MNQRSVEELRESGAAVQQPASVELLRTIADSFKTKHQGTRFPALRQVEFKREHVIDVYTVEDNEILAPALEAIQAAGVPVEPNLGSIRRVLCLTKDDVDHLFCACELGAEPSGKQIGMRVKRFADQREAGKRVPGAL